MLMFFVEFRNIAHFCLFSKEKNTEAGFAIGNNHIAIPLVVVRGANFIIISPITLFLCNYFLKKMVCIYFF